MKRRLMRQRGASRRPLPRIGDKAPDLIAALPRLLNQSIEALNFVAYSAVPGVEKRLNGESQLDQILAFVADSLGIAAADIKYWESSIVTGTWMTRDLDHFVQNALSHFPPIAPSQTFVVPVGSLTTRLRKEIVAAKSQDRVLALSSRCKLVDGSLGHIPMMDFRCRPNRQNLKRLRIALKKLQQRRGAILSSGQSFHYYGFDLLTERKWIEFFAGALLLAPLTDSRYIGHRLAENVAYLRITSSTGKKTTPWIKGLLEDE